LSQVGGSCLAGTSQKVKAAVRMVGRRLAMMPRCGWVAAKAYRGVAVLPRGQGVEDASQRLGGERGAQASGRGPDLAPGSERFQQKAGTSLAERASKREAIA
jgi:hypothetical protein